MVKSIKKLTIDDMQRLPYDEWLLQKAKYDEFVKQQRDEAKQQREVLSKKILYYQKLLRGQCPNCKSKRKINRSLCDKCARKCREKYK